MQTYVPRTKPKPKPSADMPPEVRRLRAFINGANDTQVAELRFACLSMTQMVWTFGWLKPPRVDPRYPQSALNMQIGRRLRITRAMKTLTRLPHRVLDDLAVSIHKPQWDIYLSPQQMEILYGPEPT